MPAAIGLGRSSNLWTFPGGAGPPETFGAIFSVPPILEVNANIDIVLDDDFDGVTAWLDRTPNFNNYNQLGDDSQLAIWTPGGGPGGRACVTGDGLAQYLDNTNWNPGAPGTTPQWRAGLWRLNTWSNSAHFFGGTPALRQSFNCQTSTPNVVARNTTASAPIIPMTEGIWYFTQIFFANNIARDFIQIGPTQSNGVLLGNNSQTSHALFAARTPSNFLDCSCAWQLYCAELPTPGEVTDVVNILESFYGIGSFVTP